MISAHGVQLEDKADQIRDVDRQIFETSARGAALIREGAHPQRVGLEQETLRTLWRRRDVLVAEYKKQGGREREIYFRPAPEVSACTG